MFLFKNKRLRRIVGFTLMLAGGLLMWLAPQASVGVFLLIVCIAIELAGIWLEHQRPPDG